MEPLYERKIDLKLIMAIIAPDSCHLLVSLWKQQ